MAGTIDRAVRPPAVTGPAVTGPAVTGPAVTGPAVTGPAVGPPRTPSALPRTTARTPLRRRRAVVAAVLAALCVPAAQGAAWLVPTAGTGSTAAVPRPAPGAAAPDGVRQPPAAAVAELLGRRAAAVTARDRAAWLATVDATVPGLARAQRTLFDRVAAVRPARWRYEVLTPDVALTPAQRAGLPADAVLVHVRLAYRLAPHAPEIIRDQHVTLARAGRWLVAGTDDGPQQRDLWDLGPVDVARGSRSVIVVAAGAPTSADRTATEADAAARRVDDVWGTRWPRTVVVMVPRSVGDMAALLGRVSSAGLDQLAAVTTGEGRASGRGRTTGDRVVLNPAGFAGLTAAGRSAVLTHEFTHVATRATVRGTPPLWVEEGFADYVAYLGSPLGPRDLAADLLGSRRALAGLRALPRDADFDPAAAHVGSAYAQAWLAMRLVAQQGGTAAVVDFYRVATGLPPLRERRAAPPPGPAPRTPLERACVEVLGYALPAFVRRWIAGARSLAAA